MARKNRTSLLVILLSLGVFASACSSSNDPATWAEAEADGNLQPNFINACTEANADGGEVQFTSDQARIYCECAFGEIVEYFGGEIKADSSLDDVANATIGRDFEAFKQLEKNLRKDPQTIPADVEAMLTACAQQVSGA